MVKQLKGIFIISTEIAPRGEPMATPSLYLHSWLSKLNCVLYGGSAIWYFKRHKQVVNHWETNTCHHTRCLNISDELKKILLIQ